MARRPISKKLRYTVLRRDGFRCRYCGATAKDARLHVDHIKAVAKGGTNHPDNLTAACIDCNSGKGTDSVGPMGIIFEPSPPEDMDQQYGWGWWLGDYDGGFDFAVEFDGVEPAL